MYCFNCKNQVPDGVNFCPHCGANLNQNQEQVQNQNQEQVQNQNVEQPIQQDYSQLNTPQLTDNPTGKKKSFVPVIIIVLLIVIVVLVVLLLLKKEDKTPTNYNGGSGQVQENNNNGGSTSTTPVGNNGDFDVDGPFLMAIEDKFTIEGKGTTVTGRIERGTVKLNDEVQIVGFDKVEKTAVVTRIEMFRKEINTATAGQSVAITLKDVSRDDVIRGQVICKPNTITARKNFEAKVYLYTKEEGGRHTPFYSGYNPQIYFRTSDATGFLTILDNVENAKPGDNVNLSIKLISSMPMEVGDEFKIREGGRTIGIGTVTKLLD